VARIVLGVAGGIAAYKSCEVLRGLTERGHDVRVVPTEAALQFVGAPTLAALSGHPVGADPMRDVHEVPHVKLGQQADLVLVAPATANLLAKAASGIADDLLTNVLLTARCPVVMVPAMHTEMWEHAASRRNVEVLRERGVIVVDPAVGRLTGADSGRGRLPDPGSILELVEAVLSRLSRLSRPTGTSADLAGHRVLISAGGTREPLDPVRFLGNRSSGRQGFALASVAVARGAQVEVVAANVDLPTPAGATVTAVTTAAELHDAVLDRAPDVDAVVMAAAVADFRPTTAPEHKIKKDDGVSQVSLEPTADVLAALVARRLAGQVIVGFAAETGDAEADWIQRGREKLARKKCDLLVVNQVGHDLAFGSLENAAVVLDADGNETEVSMRPKHALAEVVWDLVARRWVPAGP
jgi:phosphopantothenoylcysteine decarboxylase/phosphopantothenate--cysteine ligase